LNAKTITRRSGSNLALAFVSLGREARRDITTFYAFCRIIDDIADAPDLATAEKHTRLRQWRESLVRPSASEPSLARELRQLIEKYRLTPAMLAEIIDGVEMDLSVNRYATWDKLRVYCYRVASCVGLVSIEIFGYRNARCRDYAINMGLALQTTNIIRDVGKDLAQGRIYIPAEDLARCDYSEEDLRQRVYDERFIRLMQFQAERSRHFYERAAAQLPEEDRRSMVAAETMAAVYGALLERIAADQFRVFDKRYRLSKWEKVIHVVQQNLKSLRMPRRVRPSFPSGAK
jgi:phytoene synthase